MLLLRLSKQSHLRKKPGTSSSTNSITSLCSNSLWKANLTWTRSLKLLQVLSTWVNSWSSSMSSRLSLLPSRLKNLRLSSLNSILCWTSSGRRLGSPSLLLFCKEVFSVLILNSWLSYTRWAWSILNWQESHSTSNWLRLQVPSPYRSLTPRRTRTKSSISSQWNMSTEWILLVE